MAEASVACDHFSCPICLDLLNDPVTIPCGRSYCMSCIKICWDQEDHVGVYSCPQCRQTFTLRPVLGRNIILAEVVEKLKKTELQEATPADHHAGLGDVECDFCTGRKHKAVKSCLLCLASYCETHIQPHYESPALKKHRLIDATKHLKEKICSHHDKPLEVYCRTDQQCICYLCTLDQHRGHDTVLAAAGRTEKQKQMRETEREFHLGIEMREKELQELKEAVDSLTRSAQIAVENSERIFTEMIRSIERQRSEVTELIRDQEKAAVSRAEGVMEKLKQQIEDLKRRDSELEQISHTEDDIHFLQRCQCLLVPPEAGSGPKNSANLHGSFENMRNLVSELKNQLKHVCEKKIAEISQSVTKEAILQTPEPKNREEFLQYSYQLRLDPNTANEWLLLSEENRVVTWKRARQPYPDHQERFKKHPQVLCTEGLTGRCYWEAEWSGDWVGIAVTYKGISRKGESKHSLLGANDMSWYLKCSPIGYCVWHTNKKTEVSGPPSSRIGVYLDHRAGTLSFYSISDTMTLLHRVQTTFTQPLYPGFFVYGNEATAKLCCLG